MTIVSAMREIAQFASPEREEFLDRILPLGLPAVLRGAARRWPLVEAARNGTENWLAMVSRNASEDPVEILRAESSQDGRFHYGPDGQSLNFIRGRASFPTFLGALSELSKSSKPHAIVVQGLRASQHLPGFDRSHPMALVPVGTEPRIWIGNASKVATHNDPVENVAVVIAGRRRFTLFPPEAEGDLYLGPAHPTPAGTPVSMVHVTAPDFDRYPRFASALNVAQEAVLLPGDAIFIPRNWYHHVEALEAFNMLVNYWWDANSGS